MRHAAAVEYAVTFCDWETHVSRSFHGSQDGEMIVNKVEECIKESYFQSIEHWSPGDALCERNSNIRGYTFVDMRVIQHSAEKLNISSVVENQSCSAQ